MVGVDRDFHGAMSGGDGLDGELDSGVPSWSDGYRIRSSVDSDLMSVQSMVYSDS
eukprot:COSAG02_NODE_30583_length_548_cov_1.409800_2_plen_54_part_01